MSWLASVVLARNIDDVAHDGVDWAMEAMIIRWGESIVNRSARTDQSMRGITDLNAARLASSKVFARSESGDTFKSVGMLKPVPLILYMQCLIQNRSYLWKIECAPELFRQIDCLVYGKTAIGRAADSLRIIFVLNRTSVGLELAIEEIVESCVLRDVGL